MFRRPEELILAVVAILWVVLTYFLGSWLGADIATIVKITLATLLWVVLLFILWQQDKIRWIWPLFFGLLIACWWPYLDWIAKRGLVDNAAAADTIILAAPWYATWTFKLLTAALPVLLGYLWLLAQRRKQ
ncbi:MAG: hypothetical protein Q4G42_07155 [Neisseria sp.]|nr:hypothetical protein [Neisseria sp.]